VNALRLAPYLTAALTVAPALAQTFDAPRELTSRLPGITCAFPVDVDLDGDVDVIACSPDVPGLRVYWNDGGGDFGRFDVIAGDFRRARAAAGADMDGDGDLDLLVSGGQVVGPYPRGVWYVEGTGPGGFADPVSLVSTDSGDHIEIADLDGDGDLDAAVGRRASSFDGGALLENLGGGSFIAHATGQASVQIVPVDVDDDGRLDLLYSWGLRWRRSTAPFVYGPAQPIDLGVIDEAFGLRDLDGDGAPEIVTRLGPQRRIAVYPNSSGGFGAPIGSQPPASLGSSVGFIDVDLDGDLDVVQAPSLSPGPTWFESDGALGLVPRGALPAGLAWVCDAVGVADLDGDGLDDLLLTVDGHGLQWLRADPAASTAFKFEPMPRRITGGVEDVSDVVALDVDLDGILDIAACSEAFGLVVARGTGEGDYGPFEPAAPDFGGVLRAVAGDLDGDGLADILVRARDGRVAVFPSTAAGPGPPQVVDTLSMPAVFAFQRADLVSVLDYDGDGDLDIAAFGDEELRLYEAVGGGAVAAGPVLNLSPADPIGAAMGDLDGDGTADLVVPTVRYGMPIVWLPGTGGGAFGPRQLLGATGNRSHGSPDVLDVDGDGRDEVITAEWDPGRLVSHGVDASGLPEPAFVLLEGIGDATDIAVRDADGDGVLDCLIQRWGPPGPPSGDEVVWYPALNGAALQPELAAPSFGPDARTHLADLDGDGDLDLLASYGRDGAIFVHTALPRSPVGVEYCSDAAPNSTGEAARLRAGGLAAASANELTLRARGLPPGQPTLFLASPTQGFVPNPAGSAGDLCLGGAIGRFVGPGQVGAAGPDGTRALSLDLTMIPSGANVLAVAPMDRLFFQAWYRDGAGSNFSTGLAVVFE